MTLAPLRDVRCGPRWTKQWNNSYGRSPVRKEKQYKYNEQIAKSCKTVETSVTMHIYSFLFIIWLQQKIPHCHPIGKRCTMPIVYKVPHLFYFHVVSLKFDRAREISLYLHLASSWWLALLLLHMLLPGYQATVVPEARNCHLFPERELEKKLPGTRPTSTEHNNRMY